MSERFISAVDVLAQCDDDIQTGKKPVLYPIGTGELRRVEIGPKLVTLLGGAPGAGKTAFVMQAVVEALRATPDLRALVCNVETDPAVLIERQIARLSGVDSTTIRYRRLEDGHQLPYREAVTKFGEVADRLAFVPPPYTLDNIAAAADAFGTDLMVLDYIQRIKPPGPLAADRRGDVDAMMAYIRQIADADKAVLVVAALARAKNSKGNSSYDASALGLASFRESSELEFGADSAFLLVEDETRSGGVLLRCVKNRHGDPVNIPLHFDRPHQRFTPPWDEKPFAAVTVTDDLRMLWNQTSPVAPPSPTKGAA